MALDPKLVVTLELCRILLVGVVPKPNTISRRLPANARWRTNGNCNLNCLLHDDSKDSSRFHGCHFHGTMSGTIWKNFGDIFQPEVSFLSFTILHGLFFRPKQGTLDSFNENVDSSQDFRSFSLFLISFRLNAYSLLFRWLSYIHFFFSLPSGFGERWISL